MRYTPAIMLGIALAAGALGPAGAEIRPSSDVVLPYFEVGLQGDPSTARTTLFSINNSGQQAVEVLVTLRTNWGVPVLEHTLNLGADQVLTVNLRDWLINGVLPGGRLLSAEEIAHLQAALSGVPSPRTQLYYSTNVKPGLAIGSLTFRSNNTRHSDDIWGDAFVVDPAVSFTEGETLVNIDPWVELVPTCKRHAVRFISGGTFDAGTELMVWTRRVGKPSASPNYPENRRIETTAQVYAEDGRLLATLHLALLPIERFKVSDFAISEPFGWIDLTTDIESFVTAHYSANDNYSAALHAWCLPAENTRVPGPAIHLEKLTNGAAAQLPPGPSVPVGDSVDWTYIVTNAGDETLTAVTVEDSDGVAVTCPSTTLAVGESMICHAHAAAVACQHQNVATASGTPAKGDPVTDSDTGHYYGEERGALGLRALINGEDANTAPGPTVAIGSDVTWGYQVTNLGKYRLTGIVVADLHGAAIQCPGATLLPGETMTCTAHAAAVAGQHAFTATVSGQPACGPSVSASDPTHYTSPTPQASIHIKKLTNGNDADSAPGPLLLVGSPVTWTYVVSNNGGLVLSGVTVTDDRGVTVACPKTVLAPAESMTCTAAGTAVDGQYRNVGTAYGTPAGQGAPVTAEDASHYLGVAPALHVQKLVNGFEADTPATAPVLVIGNDVLWTYVVTNVGDTRLDNLAVTDDQHVAVTCPKTVLEPGESMTCTAGGTVVQGLYCNVGTATSHAPVGPNPTDSDTACYTGRQPRIAIEKRVNGSEADTAPGPTVLRGSAVAWTYTVSNTGDTTLTKIDVRDDQGVDVSCPKTVLEPGETMICTAGAKAISGLYCNLGTALGTTDGTTVEASDAACYTGIWPDLQIEKMTNGQDADTPPGPTIDVGATVLWTYAVTNTGDVTLYQVAVTDDKGVAVTCPKTELAAGESMVCTASGKAVAGQYSNIGTVTGKPNGGTAVSASDPSHYKGRVAGNQGCTPGYWKNHTDSWPPTGYSTGQTVSSVFNQASLYPGVASSSLLQALSFGGGSGLEGAAEILLRASVAALLNASHPGVEYPRLVSTVIGDVNLALASQNRDTMLTVAAALDADNNRGCPLN